MSTQLDPHRPHANDHHPPIYVRTLGAVEVLVHGVQRAWKGGSAGPRQLQRVFSYLVLRRGYPVQRAVLANVAGGYGARNRRHVIAGLVRMVEDWKLSEALRIQWPNLTLLHHPLWQTDTDRLDALFEEAQAISAGQPQLAITMLEAAEALCGGEYLSLFGPRFDPMLDGAKAKWQNIQKQTLVLQARLCMALPDPKRREQAFQAAVTAITFDSADPATYWLASECARLWGNAAVAQTYALHAQEIEQQRMHP